MTAGILGSAVHLYQLLVSQSPAPSVITGNRECFCGTSTAPERLRVRVRNLSWLVGTEPGHTWSMPIQAQQWLQGQVAWFSVPVLEDGPGHSCPLLQGRCVREGCSHWARRSTTRSWLWFLFCGAFACSPGGCRGGDGLLRSNGPQVGLCRLVSPAHFECNCKGKFSVFAPRRWNGHMLKTF